MTQARQVDIVDDMGFCLDFWLLLTLIKEIKIIHNALPN